MGHISISQLEERDLFLVICLKRKHNILILDSTYFNNVFQQVDCSTGDVLNNSR